MITFLKTKNFYSLSFLFFIFVSLSFFLNTTQKVFSALEWVEKGQILGFIFVQTFFFLLLAAHTDPKYKLSVLPAFFNLLWQFYLIGQGLIPSLIELLVFLIFLIFTLLILSKQKTNKTFFFLLFLILHNISIFTPSWFLVYLFLGLVLFVIHQNLSYLFLFIFSYLMTIIYWSGIAYLFDQELFFFQEKIIPNQFCFSFSFPILEKNLFLMVFLALIGIFHFLSLILGIGVKSFLQNSKALIFLTALLFVLLFSSFLQCSFYEKSKGFYIFFSLYFAFVWAFLFQNSNSKVLEAFWLIGLIAAFCAPFFF